MILAGELRYKIDLKKKSGSRDTYNQKTGDTTVATVWANRISIRSRERFAAQADLAVQTDRWQIYWRSDVTEDMWLTYDGIDYKITGIAEMGFKEGLELTTERVS